MMDNSATRSSNLFSKIDYPNPTAGPIIIAYHFKSPENMGHLIRLAANFACSKVIFIGDKESVRESKIKKVGGAAAGQVTWSFASDAEWIQFVDEGYELVALETSLGSSNITQSRLPEKMALLLGNEVYGLPDAVLYKCDSAVHIPMTGVIKSMNVSHACSIALYEWGRQYTF